MTPNNGLPIIFRLEVVGGYMGLFRFGSSNFNGNSRVINGSCINIYTCSLSFTPKLLLFCECATSEASATETQPVAKLS